MARSGLQDLARHLLEKADHLPVAATPPGERDEPTGGDEAGSGWAGVVALRDILRGETGEFVVDAGDGAFAILLDNTAKVVAQGRVDEHVTAHGHDVGGLAYVAFDTGHTVFYAPDMSLIVAHEGTP